MTTLRDYEVTDAIAARLEAINTGNVLALTLASVKLADLLGAAWTALLTERRRGWWWRVTDDDCRDSGIHSNGPFSLPEHALSDAVTKGRARDAVETYYIPRTDA